MKLSALAVDGIGSCLKVSQRLIVRFVRASLVDLSSVQTITIKGLFKLSGGKRVKVQAHKAFAYDFGDLALCARSGGTCNR